MRHKLWIMALQGGRPGFQKAGKGGLIAILRFPYRTPE
jgi:hypothetical protein